MAGIRRRIQLRRSSRSESAGVSFRHRGPSSSAARSEDLIIVNDEDGGDEEEVEGDFRSKQEEQSNKDRKASEAGTVEFVRKGSKSETKGSADSSVTFMPEKCGEECGSESSEGKTRKDCNFMKKSSFLRKENIIAKPLLSCVARRTRMQVGKQNRLSYVEYFNEKFSDDSKKEKEEEDNVIDHKSESTTDKSEGCFKKKKKLGIDVLVSVSNEKTESKAAFSNGSISQRTRSRFISKQDEKIRNTGTLSNPHCLDYDEYETEGFSFYDGDVNQMDDEDNVIDRRERKRKVSNGNDMNVDGREETDPDGNRTSVSKKRKRVKTLKDNDLSKILANTIWDNDKTLLDELVKLKSNVEDGSASCLEDFPPFVFPSGDDDAKSVDKSKYEKELDELWKDFDFALEAQNIGTYHDDEVQEEEEEVGMPDIESDRFGFCPIGKHQFILDEQIGIRCKLCAFVKLDVKHVLPPWESKFGERSTRNDTVNKEASLLFDGIFANGKNNRRRCSCGYSTGTVWDLIPGLNATMFEHQREAFEFMWRNLGGSIHLNELKKPYDDTGGCVISHAPGTGKTRLAIVFIQSYMKVFPDCRPVVVAQRGLLQTWTNEFKRWGLSDNGNFSIHNLNSHDYSGQEDSVTVELAKNSRDSTLMRLVKLYSWDKGNSVILVSYSLFSTIYGSNDGSRCSRLKKILLEKPGLIIFDEGHTPRNERSLIWKALEKVRTLKRIVLSGTPFQNNFTELYNTLCLVRPKFAEKISMRTSKLGQAKREKLFSTSEKSIAKSKWDCLTKSFNLDSKELLKSSMEEVKSIIQPFVHVHNGRILDTLPGLRKCMLVLNPLAQQKNIIEKMKGMKASSNFDNDYRNSLVSIHPFLSTVFLSQEEKALIDTPMLEKLRLNSNEGVKTKFVTELIRLCEALKEKVLVFCQYLEPLEMIMDQLCKLFRWTEGTEVLKMDGKLLTKNRQSLIDVFNDVSSEARVLLASTKACSEGISLVGASRVVLIDILWNPSMERQAISRAHRIGQGKFVYVYQLITYGTGESEKYGVQATKDKMSKLVFSSEVDLDSIKAGSSSRVEEELTSKFVAEDKILEEMTGHNNLKDMFRKVCYLPKESNNMCVFSEDDTNLANNTLS